MADLALVERLSAAASYLAVVAVARGDGSVHTSLVNAGVMEDPVSASRSVALVAQRKARKIEHMRARGRASVVFSSGYEWVAVEGPVRILGPGDHAELASLLRAVFVAAGGTHDNWDEYDRVMAEQGRVGVWIEPARITTN